VLQASANHLARLGDLLDWRINSLFMHWELANVSKMRDNERAT